MSGRNKGRRAFETEGTQHICSAAEWTKGEQALKCQSLRSLVGLWLLESIKIYSEKQAYILLLSIAVKSEKQILTQSLDVWSQASWWLLLFPFPAKVVDESSIWQTGKPTILQDHHGLLGVDLQGLLVPPGVNKEDEDGDCLQWGARPLEHFCPSLHLTGHQNTASLHCTLHTPIMQQNSEDLYLEGNSKKVYGLSLLQEVKKSA